MVTFSPPENIIHFIWEWHMCLVYWGLSQLWSAWYKKPRWSCGADYLHNYDLINRIRIRDSSWILSFTSKHIKYTTSQGYLNENHDRLATFTSRNSTGSIPSNSSKELETPWEQRCDWLRCCTTIVIAASIQFILFSLILSPENQYSFSIFNFD